MPHHSQLTRALTIGLAIIPACLILALILKWGVDTPYSDEWHYAAFFESFSEGTLTLSDLFAQQNEYRQFFPNLIIVGLGWLTKWDLRGELLVSFALACLVSFNIYRLGKLTVGGSPAQRWGSYFLANLLIFSPVQYENWLLGMQLIYFMPVACLTTCLSIAYSQLDARVKFLSCMCLATISTFSSANGILCWIIVLPLLTWPNSRRELLEKKWLTLAWVAGFVLNAALYFNDYQKPQTHPALTEVLIHPMKALGHFLTLLGKALELGDVIFLRNRSGTGHLIVAAATGLTLVALFIASALRIRRDGRLAYRAAGWLILGAYSIMTAFLVTVGRAGFGVEQALSSRYTTFTLYLPVALIHLLPLMLERHVAGDRFAGKRKMLLPVLASILILSHLLIYLFNVRQMSAFSTGLLQRKACSLFINVIREDCLTKKVYPNFEYLIRVVNKLDGLGYLRPGLVKGSRVQDIEAASADNPEHYGSSDSVTQTGEGVYTAVGWAVLPQRGGAADAILLTYDRADGNSVIFALTDTGEERNIVARILRRGSPPDYSSWQKSFSVSGLSTNPLIIRAWAFDARTGKAFKLTGTHIIRNPNAITGN